MGEDDKGHLVIGRLLELAVSYEETAEEAEAVRERWNVPCENAFVFLAEKFPRQLLYLIETPDGLDAADLTFAAEIAGRIGDHSSVRRALVALLDHREAVVREGAVYGLTRHVDDVARARLRRLAQDDSSEAVRTAALDVLDEG
jgi:hypothetical protein